MLHRRFAIATIVATTLLITACGSSAKKTSVQGATTVPGGTAAGGAQSTGATTGNGTGGATHGTKPQGTSQTTVPGQVTNPAAPTTTASQPQPQAQPASVFDVQANSSYAYMDCVQKLAPAFVDVTAHVIDAVGVQSVVLHDRFTFRTGIKIESLTMKVKAGGDVDGIWIGTLGPFTAGALGPNHLSVEVKSGNGAAVTADGPTIEVRACD